MSDKKSLFYDPENRFLWVQDGDKRIPLYTLANLNHETTRLTDDGYLQVKDSLTGMWDTVKDPAGNMLSLKGKDGVDGKDGLNGTVDEERLQQMQDDLLEAALEYHLELSNDSDQIYVGDTESYEVSIYQQLSTSVTLYQGGVLCPIDGTRWKLVVNTKELPGIVTVNDNEVITFTFPTGIKIPHDRFVYQISAILYDKNGNILKEVIKDFKVVRLAGNVDYDLAITPGYIKMASNGYLTTSQVTVKIRKKEIGLNGNAQFIVPGQLPQHLQCYYRWNQDSKQSVPYDGIISLPTDDSKKSSDKITISLENSTTTIDESHVEIVQDGTNGVSPGHIELSDDFNQLSAKDNLVEVTQRFPLEIQYYIGTEPQELSDHNIQFPSSSLYSIENIQNKTSSCVSAEIVVYAGTRILPTQLKVPISIGEVTKHFTLTKTSNTTLYSIIATPGLVKAVQDTTQSQLTWILSDSTVSIEIFERQIGQESTSSKKTNSLPHGYKLEWFVDGEEQGQVAYSNGKASVSVPQPINGVLAGKITLRLYDQYQELVDFSEVAIQANGEKGEKGDPSVLIDLTNDQDQLHITPEGRVLSTEPLTTDVHVFKGTKQLETDEYTIEVESVPNVYTASVKDSTVTVQFNPEANIDTTLSQYLIPIKVTRKEEQDIFTKNFRLVVRQDNESFDFKCSPSSLVLSKTNTLTPDHIEVVVSKTVYGATTTVEKGVDWTLSGYRLYYTVDDDSSEYDITPQFTSDGKYIGQVLSSEIKKNSTTDRPKAHFYLDDGNGVNVDHEVINSLQDGIDGTNAETYVIDFSNDSDQIYIDQNNNLYENQSVTTEVKMFDGTTLLVPDTGYRLDIQQDSSLDGVLSTFELTTSNSYRVTFNFAGVDSIPVGMNSVNFTINIKNPLGDEIILSKIYKVSVIKDSTDYDLIPSTTRVRIKQDGSLDIPYIYFTVKKKSVGSNNQQSGIIEDLASEDLVLKYTIGNSPSTASTTLSTARMSTIIPSNVNKELPISAIIELHKGSELRDFVIIDYLKDGEKGEDGKNPINISLSNDMDNINTINGIVLSSETMTTEVYIYEGLSKLLISGKGWTCTAKDDKGNNFSNITIVANSDHFAIAKTFNANDQVSNINLTLAHNTYGTYTKTFNIAAVEGRFDYDLIVSPSVLSYDGAGNLTTSTINVSVRKRIVGSPNATPELLTALPSGLTLTSLPSITSLKLGDNSISNITGLKTYSTSTQQLELQLKNGSTIIDKCVLEKIKGGTNGTNAGFEIKYSTIASSPGTPSSHSTNWTDTASASTIWMATRSKTNDVWGSWTVAKIKGEKGDSGSDGAPAKQLVCTSGNEHTFYLNPQGYALETVQSWKPTFALLEGSTQTNVSIDFLSDCVEPTGSIKFAANGIYIDRNGSYAEKTYVITVMYQGEKESYSCTLYATCVKGSMSYDLKCSPGYIKKSAAGVYTPIEFSVFSECSGGGYSEEAQTSFSSALTLWYSSTSGNDTQINKVTTSGTIKFTPTADTMTFKLKSGSQLLDFETLTAVKDGAPGTLEANVLEIKSGTTTVAGLNGTSSSQALLWGGGTWNDAKTAALSNTYTPSSGTEPITTLLKKNGTGKLGIFYISEDKVQINTPYGKVIIDDTDGIRLCDANDKTKTLIIPGSITPYIPAVGSSKTASMTWKSGTTLPKVGQEQTMTIGGTTKKVVINSISNPSATITVTYSGSCSAPAYTDDYYADVSYTYYISSTGTRTGTCSLYWPVNSSDMGDQENTRSHSVYCPSNWPNAVVPGITKTNETFSPDDRSISTSLDYETTVSYTMTYQEVAADIDPITVIGQDGMLCLKDGGTYFQVHQTSTQQRVYFKGLPAAKDASLLNPGCIYADNGYIKIKT